MSMDPLRAIYVSIAKAWPLPPDFRGSSLALLLSVTPWGIYLTLLCFSFLIFKMVDKSTYLIGMHVYIKIK